MQITQKAQIFASKNCAFCVQKETFGAPFLLFHVSVLLDYRVLDVMKHDKQLFTNLSENSL